MRKSGVQPVMSCLSDKCTNISIIYSLVPIGKIVIVKKIKMEEGMA